MYSDQSRSLWNLVYVICSDTCRAVNVQCCHVLSDCILWRFVKAKFHYASWFEPDSVMEFGSEPASVMEFGFNKVSVCVIYMFIL